MDLFDEESALTEESAARDAMQKYLPLVENSFFGRYTERMQAVGDPPRSTRIERDLEQTNRESVAFFTLGSRNRFYPP